MKLLLLFLSLNVFANPLRWAADTESGAPFVFLDPSNLNQMTGFEYDIVMEISKDLSVEQQFVQNQWDGLVPGLKAKNYDMIINGLEITDDRKKEISFSDPYYITDTELTVRKDVYTINSLSDLEGKNVGTLGGSLAERILQQYGNMIIRPYESEAASYTDLENGRIDAVLLDTPIAIYYARPNPKLKAVGGPIGKMFYGIGIRKEDKELLSKINASLKRMRESGKLREILERWNLWNQGMAEYLNDHTLSTIEPSSYNKYLKSIGMEQTWRDKLKQYVSFLPHLAKGALITIEISFYSMFLAMFVGLLLAVSRIYGPFPISFLSKLTVEILRGTPLLIQLLLIFYGLPHLGIKLSPMVAAVLGLGINYGAYEAENYRAGIQAIPKSQYDSAYALGMSTWTSFWHIILPQAFRIIIPPVTNDFISLLKDSSLVSVITMVELTKTYGMLASTYFDYLGIGLMAAAIYFIIGLPFVRLSRALETHLAREKTSLVIRLFRRREA